MIKPLALRPLLMFGFALVLAVAFQSCASETGSASAKSKKAGDNSVTIHMAADADKLNPILSTSADATYVEGNMYSAMLSYDPQTLEIVPIMATQRAKLTEISEGEFAGGMSLEWELRPECTWDDGSPITGHDFVFTMKVVKNPLVQAGVIRPYLEFVQKVVIDEANPKKFTVYTKDKYILAETFIGTYPIYPKYLYDPKGLMNDFTIPELNDKNNLKKLKNDAKIKEFAEVFNAPATSREKGKIAGSGAYEFGEWETGQRIILNRKKNWWGDKVSDNKYLQANPEKIIYKVITDRTTAVTSMKDEGMDVMSDILPDQYLELNDNNRFKGLYNLHKPIAPSYYYIGMNRRSPKLADVKVRKALAHLVDVDEICSVIMNGLAQPTIGPIHPKKPYYNSSLARIPFDPNKAKELLAEAGWKDSDGDGIVDKEIDGELMQMELSYKYNSGNQMREQIGLLLQKTAKRAGVKINIEVREWTVFLDDTKRRDYELSSLAWVQGAGLDDPKQIWHTSSDTPDGSNRVGFGNSESDKLIDKLRGTLDEGERNKLYKQFQEMVYADQPYIFMFSPKERIAIHNRFDNAKPSAIRPGYFETYFTLAGGASVAK